MSEPEGTSPFYEDFRAEADDLLSHIRRLLGSFRGARGVGQRDTVAALLRQFHTLKGLTGMVGLKKAGHLTHLVESYLQHHQNAPLPEEAVVHLAAATRDLEQLIVRPDIVSDALERYEKLFAGSPAGGAEKEKPDAVHPEWAETLPAELLTLLSPSDRALIAEGLQNGSGLTLLTFTSSAERAERGVTVNDVREAVGQRAELIRVMPRIQGRDVSFVFLLLVEASFDSSDLEVERSDLVAPGEPKLAPIAGDEGSILSSSLRVGTERLDEVVRLVEGLVVSRYRLEQRLAETGLPREVSAPLQETSLQMQRQLRDLTEALMRVRMVPLSDVLQRMPLLTQELAHESGKQVELVLRGQETRVDKNVVERLLDPLVHLVRNAVAHGLEGPQERLRLAKPAMGRVTVEARPDGNSILIAISDDGRGIDPASLQAIARARGLATRENDAQSLLDLLCEPGFSTREEAGFDAGRGVGMAIVRASVEAVGGQLRMESEPGRGTTFHLRLPLTTSIVDALLVESAGATFAIPTQELQEVVELSELPHVRLRSCDLVKHRGVSLRLYELPRLLSLQDQQHKGKLALIYGSGGNAAAFAVDRVTGLREVVVRTFGDPLVVRPWFLGATELGDGRLVLILHLPELLRRTA